MADLWLVLHLSSPCRRYGPLESVRVFPGKTFAFVNFINAAHAMTSKAALDGQPSPSVTGAKPMVIRYQKDTSTVPASLGPGGEPAHLIANDSEMCTDSDDKARGPA